MMNIWVGGIDFDLPGNGGPQCATYLSPQRQVLEFILGTSLALLSLFLGSSIHQRPSIIRYQQQQHHKAIANALLVSMTVTYLLEISYKFYTHQAIFIFQPCHVFCLVEIFILYKYLRVIQDGTEAPKALIYTFRILLYCLHAPMTAVVFPVTNTLMLPGEVLTYWVSLI